jgi:hypothetical protein
MLVIKLTNTSALLRERQIFVSDSPVFAVVSWFVELWCTGLSISASMLMNNSHI